MPLYQVPDLIVPVIQAEFYRVQKLYDKAEPLYLDGISILEEAYGPDDVRYVL